MAKRRVIELAVLYPGPLAGRLLSGWGFEVVKVEPPGGDPLRSYIPSLFNVLNAGKYSVVLDLRKAEDRSRLYKLVEDADVVLTSFRPNAAERLGVSYRALSSVNRRLVYVAVTGYSGSSLPGHDINFAAIAGLLKDGPIIPQCVDVASGLAAAFVAAVAVATGRAGYYEVPMEAAAHLLNLLNFAQIKDGVAPHLTGRYPFYNVYKCADGSVALGAVEEKFWRRFVALIGREDLGDKMYDEGTTAEVQRELAGRECSELLRRAAEADVPLSPVRPLTEVAASVDLEELIGVLAPAGGPAPKLGEHNYLAEDRYGGQPRQE